MTDATLSPSSSHPPHVLVSWPAVLTGAIVAAAVGAMLNLLGVALGAASFNPYALDGGDAAGFTAAAGMWMALANAIALFVGGAVASRAARHSDQHKGGLHGLGVWATAFLLALVIAAASAAGGAAAVAGGEAADSTDTVIVDSATGARSRVIEGELAPPLPVTPQTADAAADTTATLALWGFLTMLIGGVAAIVGGMYGARGHRWMAKAGLTRHQDDVVVAEPRPSAAAHRVYPTPRT
jgi:hypothetical protein